MKSLSTLVVSLLFSFSAHAKTLVVTDIDDTLRVTNRVYAPYAEQLQNILNLNLPFSGTKVLMDVFHEKKAKIYYLTAGIEPITELSEAFLEYNRYPQSYRFLHKEVWQDTEDFKVSEILRLIKKEKPDTVILIGDNGEKDPAAYARVQAVYPQVQVYMHYLYKYGTSVPVPETQVAYVTTAEIAAHLEHQGLFMPEDTSRVMAAVWGDLNSSVEKQQLVLPPWSDVNEDDIATLADFPFTISDSSLQDLFMIMQDIFARVQTDKAVSQD